MLLPRVEYARPDSVAEAVRLLGAHDGARALAGGQTLINVMKARAAAPDVLVDLGALPELATISVAGDRLELGAMVTCSQLIDSSEVAVSRPIVGEVAAKIADVQVRNRGTIGGNICASDPTNHFPPLLLALGATMTVSGPDGEREVPGEEFFLGVYMTAVGVGELLTRISVPASARPRDAFEAVTVGKDGTCIVNVAASLDGDDARIFVGCVAATPVRASGVEERLAAGAEPEEAARGLGETLDPPSDAHASAAYRRHLAEVLAARAIRRAREGATT
jgi:aerobic carbon-monoxide dehydrogenase medium subunit